MPITDIVEFSVSGTWVAQVTPVPDTGLSVADVIEALERQEVQIQNLAGESGCVVDLAGRHVATLTYSVRELTAADFCQRKPKQV